MLERSLRAGELVPLLTTFGLLIVIANLLQQFFSPDVHSLDAGRIGPASWHISSDLSIPWFDVLTLAVAFTVLGGLQLVLRFTQLGRELRATAEDAETAELVGVNARATAIAVAIAALAGVFYGMRSGFDPNAGASELLYAFEAVVIGGIGSLWGTLAGGIVLGISQEVGAQINQEYFALGGHVVFLAVLVARSASSAPRIRYALRRFA
jgi:branched-chain amino acid transport system permease protein